MRILVLTIALVVVGCGGVEDTGGGGTSEPPTSDSLPPADCIANGSECETATLKGGVCTKTNLSAGTLCGGSMDDAIHGECIVSAPVCHWTEYTCKYEPYLTKCIGGRCAKDAECCQFCIDAAGQCAHVKNANGNTITGGVDCP